MLSLIHEVEREEDNDHLQWTGNVTKYGSSKKIYGMRNPKALRFTLEFTGDDSL